MTMTRTNSSAFTSLLITLIYICTSCADAPPPVVPVAEASTIIKEEQVVQDQVYSNGTDVELNTADNLRLYGSIFKNENLTGQLPGAVIISAPDGSDSASVRYLANQLSARGIICISFAPRGAQGTGTHASEGIKQGHNYEWQKDDATLALKKLLKDQNINPLNIGFIGFDQAAELALFAAAGTNQPAFVVAGSLPLIDPDQKVARGHNSSLKQNLALVQQEFLDKKIDFPTLFQKQQDIIGGPIEANRVPMTADDTYWIWFNSWKNICAKEMLQKLHGPALFLYGKQDPFKATEAEDQADNNIKGPQADITAIQTTEENNLIEAYLKQQLTDKTIATIATWIQSQ